MTNEDPPEWSNAEERTWKNDLRALFRETLHAQLEKEEDPLLVGDRLGEVLRSAEEAVAERVMQTINWSRYKGRLPDNLDAYQQ